MKGEGREKKTKKEKTYIELENFKILLSQYYRMSV